jgi:hypothetical protein
MLDSRYLNDMKGKYERMKAMIFKDARRACEILR